MTYTVDARGLSCPQPVIVARKAMNAGQFPLEVLVDSVTSLENVRRMAEGAGCEVRVEPVKDEFKLTIAQANALRQASARG